MEKKTVFVISPIGTPGTAEHRRYWLTLEYVVKKAFSGDKWEVVRADEESSPDSITTQVIGRIVEADLIVADLTDHNPNVFYELAVAHGYEKPVIHLMEHGQKVPFDVVDQRVIFYDLGDPESVDKARTALIASVRWLDSNPGQVRNPLSAYGQFSAISKASGGGDAGEVVAGAIEQLSRQVSRVEALQRAQRRNEFDRRAPLWPNGARYDGKSSIRKLERDLELITERKAKLLERQKSGEDLADAIEELDRVERDMIYRLKMEMRRISLDSPGNSEE